MIKSKERQKGDREKLEWNRKGKARTVKTREKMKNSKIKEKRKKRKENKRKMGWNGKGKEKTVKREGKK